MRADEAVDSAVEAAAPYGLATDGAYALRVGENGVVVLPAAGVLARVVRGQNALDHVGHELSVADWLLSRDVPVARPVVSAPVAVDGYVVSFWEYLADGRPADLVILARCLKRLHAVPLPAESPLSAVDPFSRFEERLAAGSALSTADIAFLGGLRDRLAEQWNQAAFELGEAVVHGDAHMNNLLQSPGGRIAFVDLETVAVGPPEWDLTLTALYYECGWFSLDRYVDFVDAYGYDVRTSAAWPVLRGIRMLRMTTWLAQSAGNYPEREQQLRHRIATQRDGTAPSGWTGF
jgi:hypothetical protein